VKAIDADPSPTQIGCWCGPTRWFCPTMTCPRPFAASAGIVIVTLNVSELPNDTSRVVVPVESTKEM